jgi:hypothetical protein
MANTLSNYPPMIISLWKLLYVMKPSTSFSNVRDESRTCCADTGGGGSSAGNDACHANMACYRQFWRLCWTGLLSSDCRASYVSAENADHSAEVQS